VLFIPRVTRLVPNQVFTWMNSPLRLRQGGTDHSFSRTCGSPSHMFVKKIKELPCCRRRRPLSSCQMCSLNTHRVTPVNDTRYAVTDLAAHFASGRADQDILLHKHVGLCATCLCKRQIKYHAAAGASGFRFRHAAGTVRTA